MLKLKLLYNYLFFFSLKTYIVSHLIQQQTNELYLYCEPSNECEMFNQKKEIISINIKV